MSEHGAPAGRTRIALATLPVAFLLIGVVVYGTAEMLHGRLLNLGEHYFPEYHQLRHDPVPPKCDPTEFVIPPDAVILAPKAAGAAAPAEDEDLFADESAAADPSEKPAAPPDDEDDLFADDAEDDLFADDKAPAAGAKGPVFGADKVTSWNAARAKCEGKHALYLSVQSRITPSLERFRAVETGIAGFVSWSVGHQRHVLALLLLICALVATWIRGHIALRPASTRMDHWVSEGAQLLANGLLCYSAWSYRSVDLAAGIVIEHGELHWIWIFGFGALVLTNAVNLARATLQSEMERGRLGKALLCVPLFTTMCLIASAWFFLEEDYASGLSVYLSKLTEHSILYIHVGLYVWLGMLVKRTRLARLMFDVVRPWNLPPELLAIVVVVGAALPTAYSGASGIFVIAAGAVIYDELTHAGARRQLALASTAMSGSLGVVLNPCLLVVIVASLNKQVTTDQLYGWGGKVFLLTALLFAAGVLITRQNKLTVAAPREALRGSAAALRKLVPYVVVGVSVILFDRFVLGVHLDEHSAPICLPLMLLLLLAVDRMLACREQADVPKFVRSVEAATSETSGHIGALLMLMGLSVALGGIVERAELMAMVPETFGSVWVTMCVLVVILVIVGMTMDPYGAVILVSATIAAVAYRNGIDPVHFWMVVLVAFELGYLTPPVALNHLLTRQVVGESEAALADAEGGTFWQRHERILLPVSVMGTALVIVAFVPLLFRG